MKPIKATLHEDLVLLEARVKLFLMKQEYAVSYADLKEIARHYLRKHRVGDQFFSTWLYKLAKQQKIVINTVKGKLYYENFEKPEDSQSGAPTVEDLKKSNDPAVLDLLANALRMKRIQTEEKRETPVIKVESPASQVPKEDGFGKSLEADKIVERKSNYAPIITN